MGNGDTQAAEAYFRKLTKITLVFSSAWNLLIFLLTPLFMRFYALEPGTKQLAAWVAEETGGDLFAIQVEKPYPADWDGCLTRANEEKANDIHPELVQILDNIDV